MMMGHTRHIQLLVGFFAIMFLGSFVTFDEQLSQPQLALPHTSTSGDSQTDVHVLITISDRNGAPVAAPVTTNFLVLDNRRPTEIRDVQSLKNEPLIFSLLVDASGSMKGKSSSQIAGATKLFAALTGQNNHGYLILFRDGVVSSDQFVDPAIAEMLLRRNDGRAESTGIFDAIYHAVTKQLALPENLAHARRAIFVVSDGSDNASHISLADTLTLLQRKGITVFCIDVPTEARESEKARGLRTLRALSRETGGDVTSLDESGAFVSRLLNSVASQYVLSFPAAPENRHELHSLEVKSLLKNIKVSAPAHFLAP